jgi:hypothetical protein
MILSIGYKKTTSRSMVITRDYFGLDSKGSIFNQQIRSHVQNLGSTPGHAELPALFFKTCTTETVFHLMVHPCLCTVSVVLYVLMSEYFFFFDYLLELRGAPTFNNFFLYTTTTYDRSGIRKICIHGMAINLCQYTYCEPLLIFLDIYAHIKYGLTEVKNKRKKETGTKNQARKNQS